MVRRRPDLTAQDTGARCVAPKRHSLGREATQRPTHALTAQVCQFANVLESLASRKRSRRVIRRSSPAGHHARSHAAARSFGIRRLSAPNRFASHQRFDPAASLREAGRRRPDRPAVVWRTKALTGIATRNVSCPGCRPGRAASRKPRPLVSSTMQDAPSPRAMAAEDMLISTSANEAKSTSTRPLDISQACMPPRSVFADRRRVYWCTAVVGCDSSIEVRTLPARW